MRVMQLVRRASVATSLVALAACNFFDVQNPGPIADEDLNNLSAMPGLVTGMSFDLSRALDELNYDVTVMTDEQYHSGSYAQPGLFVRGIIRPEDVNAEWGEAQRARWVAETGIERMKEVMGADFDKSPLAARAYIYAGLANRILGENMCQAVFDGSAPEDNKVHFSRAEAQFTEALKITATLTGGLRDSLTRAAYGGRAQVRAAQGKWADAVADAQLVPINYVFVAFYSTNTADENNQLVVETNTRREFTVYNTQWAQVFKDPRVPWDTIKTTSGAIQTGQDGRTPFFRQRKYVGNGADVPLVKGTEMVLLRAEAALRNNDVAGAMQLINQQRAFYSVTATPLPPLAATTAAEAWPILEKERGAVLWLEVRRFWDLRRWNAEAPPIKNTFLDNRDKCIPISENERQSNPNVR